MLGPPAVTVGGLPLAVDTRKAVAVLAVLAADGTTSRQTLATRLWPDSDEAHARGALRRTLSVLNGALGPGVLTVERAHVGLAEADDIVVDVRRAESLVQRTGDHGHGPAGACPDCVPLLRAACALHRGAFLEGFALRDAPDFDEWRGEQTERFRRLLVRTLDRLTRAEAEQGDLEAALEHTHRWLAADPLSEQAHARAMIVHALRGERSEAVRRYRDCVATLDRELGVLPLTQTTQLHQAILAGHLVRGSPAVAVSDPEGGDEPALDEGDGDGSRRAAAVTFVGRDVDLGRALRHLARPGNGLLTIHGETGIGKTRLVEELEARLTAEGRRPLGVRCHPDERHLAHAPFVELLRGALARPDARRRLASLPGHVRAEAARLVPTIGPAPSPGPLSAPGGQVRLLDGVITCLLTMLGPRPVVRIDDVDLADDTSLDLLCFWLRRLDAYPAGLVLTWTTQPSALSCHAASRVLEEPAIAARRCDVPLGRLSFTDTLELCRALPPGPRDHWARRLAGEAEGLPLALVEYVRWVVESGAQPSDPWPLPQGLRDLLSRRLDELEEGPRELLVTASVLAHELDLDLLQQLSGRDADACVACVEALLDRGMLRAGDAGRLRFGHEKLRVVAYERMSPPRRRLLHRRVATALAERERARGTGHLTAVVAEHARLGGDDEAASWAVRAGDHAASVLAHPEAARHYRRALALVEGTPAAATDADRVGPARR